MVSQQSEQIVAIEYDRSAPEQQGPDIAIVRLIALDEDGAEFELDGDGEECADPVGNEEPEVLTPAPWERAKARLAAKWVIPADVEQRQTW